MLCLSDMKTFSMLCTAAALLGVAAPSLADDSVVRPSTNPWFATVELGPSIGMLACGSGGCASGGSAQFKLTESIGYHTNGSGDGFAIGLGISEAFGQGLFRFQPGLRLWGDIPVSDDLGIYITPLGHLGYGLLTGGGRAEHTANIGLGLAGRIVLGDRAMISFSPLHFDMLANGNGFVMAYDLSFGAGVTF